ncbi:DNA primase [Maritimibacter sp. UBA3975]|uniref:DNA primase n=1 Tax=Maritimibacter sp. UBA3975 TaxID=1946833 RepID=UPI000C099403|nr:DNA primase [Maritimibacter sp. UBA3975]MAM61004.1 DNA primase [Maritimibacter sp.]|tara:strand:+ start:3154 stop:5139 length:1986 start_codon:yes stop_codon:yes gene_type:complete
MSLPPGFLDELRTRTSLAQVVGRKVMWDQRKSNQAKGDLWAPCPFHQEKTASFHVDDRKGFYYCFGCHAKGDAIGFVKETENVGFMEAIEILAREAGMQMPARDPKAQEKADRRTQLAEVMEQAVQYYRLQLKTNQGTGAREYLDRRGLKEDAQARWDIGFAPDNRQGVIRHLKEKGVAEDLIVDSGLAIKPDEGGNPYDRFRGRIIFPIRDPRGRAISLGGRALDPNARAKYLNGPETELFDKGRSLFNHGPAREAAGKGAPLVVAEGYMDVIALSEAGFGATVAPLGTAITEDQLRLLWRIGPEPIIALDGDTAGLRAAMRVIDTALPLLEAGQSLRFAIMPEGLDPDDLIKAQGAGAMQKVLDAARPMVSLLWQRETEGKSIDSPERRAALDRDLRTAIARIQDPSIRQHYGEEIKRLRYELFNPRRDSGPRQGGWQGGGKGGRRGPWKPAGPAFQPATKGSLLAAASGQVEEVLREAVILATIITHPRLMQSFESAVERIDMATEEHAALQRVLLSHHTDDSDALREKIQAEVGLRALEKLFALNHVQIAPPIRRPDDSELAALCLAEELAKLEASRGARREVDDAAVEIDALADEGLTWRLSEAVRVLDEARRGQGEDKGLFERADNGVLVAREEKDALDALLKQIEDQQGGRKRP